MNEPRARKTAHRGISVAGEIFNKGLQRYLSRGERRITPTCLRGSKQQAEGNNTQADRKNRPHSFSPQKCFLMVHFQLPFCEGPFQPSLSDKAESPVTFNCQRCKLCWLRRSSTSARFDRVFGTLRGYRLARSSGCWRYRLCCRFPVLPRLRERRIHRLPFPEAC